MKKDDSLVVSLLGRGKGERPCVLDLEKIEYLLKRFADVEEFLGQKLSQLKCYRL